MEQSEIAGHDSSSASPPAGRPRRRLPRTGGRRLIALLVLAVGGAVIVLAAALDARVAASPPNRLASFSGTGSGLVQAQAAGGDRSQFPHGNPSHSRLPCLLCHRRETNAPQPVRSLGHTPCSGCHTEQFAAARGPLCTICHVKAGSAEVKPFPTLQSFTMKFDHARHKNAACSTCHKPAQRGVALTIPAGGTAHPTCFSCHTPRAQAAGRDISSCGVCHQAGPYRRTPVFTKAYRVNFSHGKHGARQDLNCADCHTVRAGMPQARQVTAPAPAQHFGSDRAPSCMTCHNNKRAFGESFSDCKRCHQGPTFRF
jgi:c(7)-type cytochrome triheme protein